MTSNALMATATIAVLAFLYGFVETASRDRATFGSALMISAAIVAGSLIIAGTAKKGP